MTKSSINEWNGACLLGGNPRLKLFRLDAASLDLYMQCIVSHAAAHGYLLEPGRSDLFTRGTFVSGLTVHEAERGNGVDSFGQEKQSFQA